ncbi:MAG: hypothetical protein H8K03_20395 [Nitrospira sp.]
MTPDEIIAQRLVAKFLAASSSLETYLQRDGPLTHIQVETVALAIDSLRTFFEIWQQKQGLEG